MKTSRKAKETKKTRRRLKLVKSKSPASPQSPLFPDVSDAGVQPPPGFRVLSSSQALMEFGLPLIEIVDAVHGNSKKFKEAFLLSTEIWNYAIDEKMSPVPKKPHSEMLFLVSSILQVTEEEAEKILTHMVERKLSLFPEEIQPRGTPYTFMRKEVSYLIARFDDSRLSISPEVFPPTDADAKLFENLSKLDWYVKQNPRYAKFSLLMKVHDGLDERFNTWLTAKGVVEYQESINFIAGAYLEFIYGNQHKPPLILSDEPGKYLAHFTLDFLLSKTSMEPWEYTLAPAALKLLYRFLYEKDYLTGPPDMLNEFMDVLEPHLVEVLKERFS